jgi:hypothetical protein
MTGYPADFPIRLLQTACVRSVRAAAFQRPGVSVNALKK